MIDQIISGDNAELEGARHNALVENTAQEIFYEIQRLENSSVAREQWIWELLQNALDAQSPGMPVRVRISWDGETLVFQHNGDVFTPDEISHLIYHGTTKYKEHNKRGKFGRGFLVTHLLSKCVEVRGIEKEQKGSFSFQIELDRNRDIDSIRKQMDNSFNQLTQRKQPLSLENDNNKYSTEYTYRTKEKGKEIADSGINYAKDCLPYVLFSIPELEEICLINREVQTTYTKKKTVPND